MSADASRFPELLRRRALTRLIDGRLRVAPAVVLLASGFAALEPTPLRLALFGGCATGLLALALAERNLKDPSDARLSLSVAITGLIQLTVMFAAGGIGGPVLPGTVLVALSVAILLRPLEAAGFVLGVQIPAVWLFALVHRMGWVPGTHIWAWDGLYAEPGTPGWGPVVAASFLSIMLAGAYVLGRTLRKVIDELVAEMAEDRQASLEVHLESARAMSALSGEIAHELKNPLASIKGLTALVRRDVSGVTAERVDVLRREVDRMQAILDEFLAYSRPIVPLAIERTDLSALTEDVVHLHEGLATERGVTLEIAPGPPIHVRCDPRKVRQVIINLLQNALDATPAGGTVRARLRARGRGAEVVVEDDGSGIAPEVADKLFQVGVTSKPKGTGLGLVVSRGLARQHGGELVLGAREGRGAIATLTLPEGPPDGALAASPG